ncbi:SHOCT domain-containing protein [Salinisphaera sp. T31B1]|uniref:SHOCT domain-containing protein n=1 Tax=Salinisphaera sp. T31B1 TaxID=727963 RepID=UPI00333E6CF5
MSRLPAEAQPHIETLAQRHGFSEDAITRLLAAVAEGQGRMAEFDHPEFGGPAMWMTGGMLMLTDSGNHALKAQVDAACNDVAALLAREPWLRAATIAPAARAGQHQYQSQRSGVPAYTGERGVAAAGDRHWPADLGTPSVTGSQNGLHYAWFSQTCRLAVEDEQGLRLFDTGEYRVTGAAQQQSDGQGRFTLTTQYGPLNLAELPQVGVASAGPSGATERPAEPTSEPGDARRSGDEAIFAAIERLGELKERGLLSIEEFDAKKAELLARL